MRIAISSLPESDTNRRFAVGALAGGTKGNRIFSLAHKPTNMQLHA
jgi:hypothetical protein